MIFARNTLWASLAAAGAFQTVVLGWMVYDRVSLLMSKREILLDVVPVDPRSLFRGDYVRLGYNISRLETGLPAEKLEKGATLYVTLEQDGGGWRAVKTDTRRPASMAPGHVMLKGRVETIWHKPGGEGQIALMRYGIESYFVPEGEGR